MGFSFSALEGASFGGSIVPLDPHFRVCGRVEITMLAESANLRRRLRERGGARMADLDSGVDDADWLLTLDHERRVVRDARSVVTGGRIVAVGKTAAVAQPNAASWLGRGCLSRSAPWSTTG
jgi:hypothetical protein